MIDVIYQFCVIVRSVLNCQLIFKFMNQISKKYLLFFLLIGILLQLSIAEDTNPVSDKTFEVGQTISGRATDGRVFNTISVKEVQSKYFFIHLQMDADSKNFPVRLFIYLQGNVNPLKVCEQAEIDSCYLSRDMMKQNTNILLLTDSTQKKYGFTLRTYWSDIQHLLPNSEVKFYFSQKDQSQFYHLQLNNTNFHQLRIILKPQTIRSAFDKIRIYGSYGQNSTPSQTEYHFKSIHLWQDAEGVFLYGKEVTDKNMNLLIVGQIETVYLLSCEIVQKEHHDLQLGEMVHEYLQPSEEFTYHADFFRKADGKQINHLEYDQYVLTFSGFSGKLVLGFYLNIQRTQSLDIQPFQYLSDAQYVFKKQQIETKLRKGLFIYVHSLQRKSVYSMNFYGRNRTTAIRLNQNIHEFVQITNKNPVLTYFQLYHWANDTTKDKFEYSVALTNVIGENQLEFRTCSGDLEDCLNPNKYHKVSQLQNAIVTTIGTKQTFMLSFTRQALQKTNHAEDIITVIVIIKNKIFENGSSFVALEYRSQNRLYFLREGKPFESRIKQNQYKIFKYVNQDRFLKEIKIYVSEISGKIDVYSLRQQPTATNRYGKEETNSVVVFNKDLAAKPIYLVVEGKDEAIFSLQLVSVHKSDESISALTLTEDLDFSLRIKPQGNQIVQVIPIHDAIYFEYKASGSILVCAIDPGTGDCQKDFSPKLNKTGDIDIQPFKGRSKMFKLMNPSDQDIIQVTVVYHSNDIVHCEQRQLGMLYYETIQKEEIVEGGFQNNCYTFFVSQFKDMSLKLSRIDLGEIHYAVALCNSLLQSQAEISSEELKISADQIQNLCQNSTEKTITLMISPHKNQDQRNKMVVPSKLKYLLQYVDQRVITIPDGVAYDFEGRTSESPVKIFYYDMMNKKQTTIKLNQYSGFGAFSVHVVPTGRKQSEIDATNYDYGFSKADSYFLNPTLTITQEMLSKKQCEECSLIIKVYSMQEVGIKVSFGLEVIQNHKELEDHEPVDGYLTKNSMDFFSYTTVDSKIAGSLIIEVNDYNRRCVRIYLSDYDYPDEKNFILKEEGNQLVYKDVEPQQNYYIALQAIEDCPYSVTVSSTKVPITKLKRGYSSMLSLEKGEVKYFMIEHLEKKEFRILSILEHGQTYIYMNKTTTKDLQVFLQQQQQKIDYGKFEVKSDYANRLVLHQNNSYLTQNAIYIIAVEGRSQTEGYLFYGDVDTNLQIISDTYVNDQLTVAGEVFRGEYYGEGNITLQVNVIVGELNIQLDQHVFKDFNNKTAFDQNFTSSKTTYLSHFELKPGNQSYFMREPVEVKFTAIKPFTVYSFRFVIDQPKQTNKNESSKQQKSSNQQQQRSTQSKIQPGQPNYIQLLSKYTVPSTFTGILTHGEQIFISVPIEQQQKLIKLELKAFVDDKEASIDKTMVRNIMKIKLSNLNPAKTNYKFEVKSQHDISLTVYQNYGLNLLAPDSQVLIEGTNDYVLYPQNSVLLDLFECEDNASILYSHTKSALDTLESKSLDLIGMPSQPHAIKIINPGVTFVRIKSKRSYFRWLPIDTEKGKGMGYLDYDIGSITYTGSLLQLTVQWDPVYAKRQTNSKLNQVNYVLIIGADTSSVKSAINCQNYDDPNLLYYHYNTGASANGQKVQIDLSKTQIKQKYQNIESLFIGIVAEVVLKVPSQKQERFEHYRFVYHTQQLPLQVFKEYTVASKDAWLVVLIAAGVIFLLSLTCLICVRKVAPIISRLRQGNAMVEEQKDDKQFDVIPPSSDRNQIQTNNLQTEQVMK